MFINDKYVDRIEKAMQICDMLNKGWVTEGNLYAVFKTIAENIDDKTRFKLAIKDCLNVLEPNNYDEYNRVDVTNTIIESKFFKILLNDIVRNCKKIAGTVEQDLQDHFLNWIP
jgi:hypothetical protein